MTVHVSLCRIAILLRVMHAARAIAKHPLCGLSIPPLAAECSYWLANSELRMKGRGDQ